MHVFVIGKNGTRLMPCSERKARILLKSGKADVYQKFPFSIKLNYTTGFATQQLYRGCDTGAVHEGISVVRKNSDGSATVLYKTQVDLRQDKKSLLDTRRKYRQGKRYRKTRYRKCKFKYDTKRIYNNILVTIKHRNRDATKSHWAKQSISLTSSRPTGWLPPSLQSRVDIINRLLDSFDDVLPLNTIRTNELGRFDVEHMKNSAIRGEEYQHGPQYGYENVKAYVLARDKYKCFICHKTIGPDRKGRTHHVNFRSKGATDRPEELITVCECCHTPVAHNPGGVLHDLMLAAKPVRKQYKEPVLMNIIRCRLRQCRPFEQVTYGNITNVDRKTLGLSKSHVNDATVIAIKGVGITIIHDTEPVLYVRQVRKKKRSLHEATPRKGRTTPNRNAIRNVKNVKACGHHHLYDKVDYNGSIGWITGFTGKSAYIQDIDGNYITMPGKTYKQIPVNSLKIRK